MRLADCYRLLDLEPGASFEEVKKAHRDLTKVWHPDRFGNDAPLRQKAEEKLKAINQAYESIRTSRERSGGDSARYDPADESRDAWRVRSQGREMRVADLEGVARLVVRGAIGGDAELFDPASRQWIPVAEVPQLRHSLALVRARRNRGWALTLASVALFILLRKPTPGGFLIALAIGGIAFYFVLLSRIRD